MIDTATKTMLRYGRETSPILPVGWTSVKTGKCDFFNIYETWAGSTVEVFKDGSGKTRYVVTSGSSSLTPGERRSFCHDQTRRSYGSWTFTTAMPIERLKEKGTRSGFMYCYK